MLCVIVSFLYSLGCTSLCLPHPLCSTTGVLQHWWRKCLREENTETTTSQRYSWSDERTSQPQLLCFFELLKWASHYHHPLYCTVIFCFTDRICIHVFKYAGKSAISEKRYIHKWPTRLYVCSLNPNEGPNWINTAYSSGTPLVSLMVEFWKQTTWIHKCHCMFATKLPN